MTERAKVIRLEPDVKRHVRARLARLAAPVQALHESGKKALASLLLHFFDAADDALFDLADKAQSNAEQNLYFNAMRELRVQRKGIERRLLECVDEYFARLVGPDERDRAFTTELKAEQLTAVDNDDLEQIVAVEAAIARAEVAQGAQIAPVIQALGSLLEQDVDQQNYPFSAHNLCLAAVAEFDLLEVDLKAKLSLFQVFERVVIGELNLVHQALIAAFEQQGVTVAEQSSAAERERKQPSATDAADVNRHELLSLLSFVQKLPLGTPGPEGLDLERVLKTVQHRRGVNLQLSRVERETIQLVQTLFRLILQGQSLSEPMLELLCRLQVPVVKVALMDAEFFTDNKHPVRRLLNSIAAEAAQWRADERGEQWQPVQQAVKTCVEKILARFDTNINVFNEALADFTSAMAAQRRAAQLQEQRTVDAEDGKARADAARQHVAAEILSRTEGNTVPPVVQALIEGPWSNVLFVTGLKFGFASAQWNDQLKLLSDLVWSVQPKPDAASREQLHKKRQKLVQALRRALDSVSFNPFEVEELFLALDELHFALLRDEQNLETAATPAEVAKPPLEVEAEIATNAADQQPLVDELPADDPHMIAVSAFSHGAWFELAAPSGETWRCRLAAYIKPTDKYIFVDRGGIKVAEQSRNELALALKQGRLKPLDNNVLFDRALESVVSGLRKTHSGMPFDQND